MALNTPMTQEQLIAQALGAASMGGPAAGMPGAGGMPAPSGMPGAPALDPQMLAQALGAPTPAVNPAAMQLASSADVLAGEGSFADYLAQVRDWRTCMASGRDDCGPQPVRGNPLPAPPPATPVGIGL